MQVVLDPNSTDSYRPPLTMTPTLTKHLYYQIRDLAVRGYSRERIAAKTGQTAEMVNRVLSGNCRQFGFGKKPKQQKKRKRKGKNPDSPGGIAFLQHEDIGGNAEAGMNIARSTKLTFKSKLEKCGVCGGVVTMPCVKCAADKWKQKRRKARRIAEVECEAETERKSA